MAKADTFDADVYDRPRTFRDHAVMPHAERRFDDDRRPITRKLAKLAIKSGTVEANPGTDDGSEYRYRHPIDGLDVVVVIGAPDPSEGRDGYRIVTAFVDVVDATAAWVGDVWAEDDVHVAAMLQYLNAGYEDADVGGMSVQSIDVYDPIEYGGHILSWNRHHTEPFCHACRHETIDGDEWKRRPCPTR